MSSTNMDAGPRSPTTLLTGVVEDVNDPLEMGRVRVRWFGIHTRDRSQIPIETLPWALVVTPVHSASCSGIGRSPTGLLPGSWVVGFHRDGESFQEPIVLGSIPSATPPGDPSKGFSDPSGINPVRPGAADCPRESRSDYRDSPAYVSRVDSRQTGVPQAVPPRLETVSVPNNDSYYQRKTWDTPSPVDVVGPVYPDCHAERSRSGHVREVDDTPGSERTLDFHRSGTYREVARDGSETVTVVGDRYTAVLGRDSILVRGSATLTVDGDLRQLVRGNYHLEVEGDATCLVRGSRQAWIGLSDQTEVGQEVALNVGSNSKIRVGGDVEFLVDGSETVTIGSDSLWTIGGDLSEVVGGARRGYSDGVLEMSTSGRLVLASGSAGASLETLGGMELKPSGDLSVVAGGSVSETAGSSISLNSGSGQTISAGGSLSVTAASVSVSSGGNSASPPWA